MKGFWSNVNFIRLLTQTNLTETKKDSIEENKSDQIDILKNRKEKFNENTEQKKA